MDNTTRTGKAPDNPFEYGRELDADELADRRTEVREVRDALLGGSKYFLIGPRRYGKSSVHNVGAHQATRRGAVVLRYNVEGFSTPDSLLRTIVTDTARLLTGTIKQVGQRLEKLFRALRPELAYNPLDQSWSVGFDPRADVALGVPRLVEVLDGIERAAAGAKRPVGLILDEVQHLVAGGIEAERQLRAAIQTHRHVGYVFAGSDTRLLAAMTSDPARPFYRLGDVRVLGAIPRAEFAVWLRRGFDRLGNPIAADALDGLLEEAEDVPYNVQLLAHQCWNALRDLGRKAVLTRVLVHDAQITAARRMDPVYSQAWLALPMSQRRALLALIAEGGKGLYSSATALRYELPPSSMKKALEGLLEKQVIRRERQGTADQLRLEDPLFRTWIREFTV